MATRPADTRPFGLRARVWVRQNLFSSAANTALTVLALLMVIFIVVPILRFVLVSAEWDVITANRRLIFIGLFPSEHEWRLWPPLWLLGLLGGLTYGLWSRVSRTEAILLGLIVLAVFGLLAHGLNGLLLAVVVLLAGGGYALARLRCQSGRARALAVRGVIVGWAIFLPFTFATLAAFGGAQPSQWGGFYLNLLLAAVGIGAGFPIGVLLALGRASSYPAISLVCTGWIEFVRGAPLAAWIFIGWFVLPHFLPGLLGLSDLGLIARVMIVFSMFTGAYIAEIVRGGLQSLPRGQTEAAEALGMSSLAITAYIVLPQALRAVIPPLVGQFISLWKDTTLVSILPIIDALAGGEAALSQREFFGRQQEVLLFVAALFWVVAFAMSRLSLRLERRLGVGTR